MPQEVDARILLVSHGNFEDGNFGEQQRSVTVNDRIRMSSSHCRTIPEGRD